MPDWKRFVAERLARSALPPEIQREVVAEISEHLDDCHDELTGAGSADPEAETMTQVTDWTRFGRRIRRAKEDPMGFAKKVFMPGVAAAILAMAMLRLFVFLFVTPEPCPAGEGVTCVSVMVSADGPAYLPWLATLPIVAGLGAVVARRMGATPMQRLAAALFPVFYLAAEVFVLGFAQGDFFWRVPIYWVLVPAIACAIGALPPMRNQLRTNI